MKRFWTEATVTEDAGRYAIKLDGRPMRLPGGPVLALQSRALAHAIAEEWQAAGETLAAEHVPLTRIAGTAQERVAPDPEPTIAAIAAYGETDLLCYRAAAPEALVRRQEQLWQPWLAWAARVHDAHLRVTSAISHVTQPPAALAALRAAVARRPAFELAGLGILVPATGSLVLGLAVADGAMDAAQAHELAALDELFQAEQWGEDHEAAKRRHHVAEDIAIATRFIRLSSAPPG